MSDISPDLQKKINQARSLASVPASQPLVRFASIGALLREQADRQEQNPFLIFFDDAGHRREYSYREFFEEVCKTANCLIKRGIRRGDRIATVSQNHCDTVIQYFAAFTIGAVVVPVNTGEDDRRISYILSNSGCCLAFVRQEYVARINAMLSGIPGLKTVIQVGGTPDAATTPFEAETERQPIGCTPPSEPELSDEALIVYTSGTTGLPKGVVLTQYNLLVDAMAIAEWHELSPDQRMMCVLPIHHVNGTVVTLLTPLFAGCSVVLNQKFQTDKFFQRISSERVHIVSVVPTLLQFLLHAKISTDQYALGHFRHIICGAGPLTVELALKFEQEYHLPIIHGYGLSETTCYSCFLPVELTRNERTRWLSQKGFPSIGVPIPVNEMSIHDEHGNELQEGIRGEIVIRGHNVMKHYFQNPEANETTFAHGWFRSGDEGFFVYDDQNRRFFFITGRLKELIIRGGVNISPFEIDEILMNIPGVHSGIAVGFDNDWYGEEVGAYVKLKEGISLTEETVIAHCRKSLPFTKSPKVIVFGNDIPVTSTGKYQRNRCKDLFAAWKGTQFKEKGAT
jgi:acyl-CoA synthetase (AMP-forming)/AMP-acid ligase II